MKKIPRKIINVINNTKQKPGKNESKGKIDFFPSFYWPEKSDKYDLHAYALPLQNLAKTDPLITLSGLVPETLTAALTEVKVPKRKMQVVIQKIFSIISRNTFNRWKSRCRKLYSLSS